MNDAGARIRNVNGPSGIDRDRISASRCSVFKAEQRYSGGLKLLDEAGGAVSKIDPPNRVYGRSDGVFKLPGLSAAHAPFLDELDCRRLDHLGRLGMRSRTANQLGGKSDQDNPEASIAAA